MRIALILLSILALVFIGSISWSLLSGDGFVLPKKNTNNLSDSSTESYWRNQIKTEEKIEKLTAIVEELSKKNGTSGIITTNTGTREDTRTIVKISGKFLALVMPAITPALGEQTGGIFDLHVFDQKAEYSLYEDPKYSLTIIPISLPYDTLLKNMYALGPNVYSVNETKSFPFRSFYLNPPKSDTLVRLIIEMEGQSIGLQIPKTKFSTLKDLLLGKSINTKTPAPIPTTKSKTISSSSGVTTSTGSIKR